LPAAKRKRKIDPTPCETSNYTRLLSYFVSGIDRAEIRSIDTT